jgi:hypothetical protein
MAVGTKMLTAISFHETVEFMEGNMPTPRLDLNQQDATLREALHLIKKHIGWELTEQNVDLHTAVQHIVNVGRQHGLLSN